MSYGQLSASRSFCFKVQLLDFLLRWRTEHWQMEAWSAQFVWFALTFSPLLYKLTVLLFLWGVFCSAFHFISMLSLFCSLSSVFSQAKKKKKNPKWALGSIWSCCGMSFGPLNASQSRAAICATLCHRGMEPGPPPAPHTLIPSHPSISVWDGEKCPKRPVPLTAPRFLRKTFGWCNPGCRVRSSISVQIQRSQPNGVDRGCVWRGHVSQADRWMLGHSPHDGSAVYWCQ